jgi:hypothetical protein
MTMRALLSLAAFLLAAGPALADGGVPPVTDPLVKKECGACHMAFQPALLPARSWSRITATLHNHFGEDATLPTETVAAIGAYLTAHAGDAVGGRRAGKFMRWVAPSGAPQRITENPYFQRKHLFADSVWRDPKVVTKSNCPACHQGADQGWYDD